MALPSDIWGFSLFCDDLRSEYGGKVSIMGLYNSDLIFQSTLPFTVPKLTILVMVYLAAGQPAESMTINVFLPGDAQDTPSITFAIPAHNLPAIPLPPGPALEPDQQSLAHYRFPITLQPFVVNKEGYIKVRIVRAGMTFNFGSLRIRKPTVQELPLLIDSNFELPPNNQ